MARRKTKMISYWNMNGTSSTLAHLLDPGAPISPSVVNSITINAVVDNLASHLQSGSGNSNDAREFYDLCLKLSRGINYAVANDEIPAKAADLPKLMKQLCQRTHDEYSHRAIIVLMISMKSASQIGWFSTQELEELYTIADEIEKTYCSLGNVNAGLSYSCHSTVLTIMERFYPKMKLGPVFVTIEVKSGYGACVADFPITKSMVLQDQIWLFVAQTDNIETSTCLISPQQVNFLLNGKGVDRRTDVHMDTGPQMPTNVTGMLKFGTNLLQAVGQFNGNYVILIAYMSVTSLPEHRVLQDYVQPAVTSVDSDSDIIEGPSQISLNCPISLKRIKNPVKGRSCKHFQCFDFDNFININSTRPSWCCPHCNQHVCYADIDLDRNMAEILKDVGENIAEVNVLADGSWKAVFEPDNEEDDTQNTANNCEKKQTEPQESTCSPSRVPDVVDLTNDEDQMGIMDTCETADGNLSMIHQQGQSLQASVQTQFVTRCSTSLTMNSAGGMYQNVTSLLPSSSTAIPCVSFSKVATADGFNAILTDTERQQPFSRTPVNLSQASAVNASTLLHHSATQNRVTPGNMSTPSQNPYRPTGSSGDFRNPHLQQALNQRPLQAMRSSNSQQGGQQPMNVQTSTPVSVQNQTSAAATSYATDTFPGFTGDRRGSVGGTAESVSRPNDLFNSPQAGQQNWRPPARMRGSLLGRQYSDEVRQRLIVPTPPPPLPVRSTGVSPLLDVLIANNTNIQNLWTHNLS